MIIGIGHDIIEIERVRKAVLKRGFLTFCYTQKEINLLGNRINSLASNFAVKEAVSKAFGTGFSDGLRLKDIEVLRDDRGKPYVNLYGRAKELSEIKKISQIHVSISDTKDISSAFVIMED